MEGILASCRYAAPCDTWPLVVRVLAVSGILRDNIMAIMLALILLYIGSIGVLGAVIMEIKAKEPVYMIMMKVFPWVFGVGGILLAVTQ